MGARRQWQRHGPALHLRRGGEGVADPGRRTGGRQARPARITPLRYLDQAGGRRRGAAELDDGRRGSGQLERAGAWPQRRTPSTAEVTVGPVAADEGTLGVGKLGAPKDKYTACVQKNGGVSGKTGEVSVRFLVRSKGVAEGVSVAKRTNLSKEAAQCVAEVIDRRRVGTPESPMVGATVLVKFTRLDKLAK